MLGAFLLGACSGGQALRAVGLRGEFGGGVAGDEPRAVLVARDVLAAGGNAADAAVAFYFTAAVTYPAAASLGAGGACLVYDARQDRAEALRFPAARASAARQAGVSAVGVPGAPRGLYALHARYGRLPWRQLLGPAEKLARFGHPVSRALARQIDGAEQRLLNDPASARVFARPDGAPLREGDTLVQLDLATVLGRIRAHGPGAFYAGELARKFVAAVERAGGSIVVEDLRDYRPVWRATVQKRFDTTRVHVAGPPESGLRLLQMWAMLVADDRYEDAGVRERGHLFAQVVARAASKSAGTSARVNDGVAVDDLVSDEHAARLMAGYRPDGRPVGNGVPGAVAEVPSKPEATGFVVVDAEYSAVACVTTLNRSFGAGLTASGVVVAAPPRPPSAMAPTPAMIVNHNTRRTVFAGAATGGDAAVSALLEVMARAAIDHVVLPDAVAAPRLHPGPASREVLHEPSEPGPWLEGLTERGYTLVQRPDLGRVNAAYCPQSSDIYEGAGSSCGPTRLLAGKCVGGGGATIRDRPEGCGFSNDGRGHGLAADAQL